MTDLIKRSDVLALLAGDDVTGYKPSALREMVERVPAVDAVPVVHGRWIKRSNEKRCSVKECGFIYYSNNDEWNYCPNCGANMMD